MNEILHPFWLGEAGADGRRRVGLTEGYLETIAEELVGLELSGVGERVARGEVFGFLHTTDRTLDLRAPVAMEIVAINQAAIAETGMVRTSPYGRGWLVEVREIKA